MQCDTLCRSVCERCSSLKHETPVSFVLVRLLEAVVAIWIGLGHYAFVFCIQKLCHVVFFPRLISSFFSPNLSFTFYLGCPRLLFLYLLVVTPVLVVNPVKAPVPRCLTRGSSLLATVLHHVVGAGDTAFVERAGDATAARYDVVAADRAESIHCDG
jgi:hypothetical protein